MKLKQDKIVNQIGVLKSINEESVLKNKNKIDSYISKTRAHLIILKDEIYKTVDAGLENVKGHVNGDFDELPSIFLHKAYAVQTYDANGKGIDNRYQPHIFAGQHCDEFFNKPGATQEQRLIHDVGQTLTAINHTLSMLNKIESNLIIVQPLERVKRMDKFDEIQVLVEGFDSSTVNLIKAIAASKIVELVPKQSNFQKALSKIIDLAVSFKSLFITPDKKDSNQYKERYKEIKEQFKQAEPTEAPAKEKELDPLVISPRSGMP